MDQDRILEVSYAGDHEFRGPRLRCSRCGMYQFDYMTKASGLEGVPCPFADQNLQALHRPLKPPARRA